MSWEDLEAPQLLLQGLEHFPHQATQILRSQFVNIVQAIAPDAVLVKLTHIRQTTVDDALQGIKFLCVPLPPNPAAILKLHARPEPGATYQSPCE